VGYSACGTASPLPPLSSQQMQPTGRTGIALRSGVPFGGAAEEA
jgi:hypothetical protein